MSDYCEHLVQAIPPDGEDLKEIAWFSQSRWQMAEKLAGWLESKGFREVEVVTIWLASEENSGE